MSLSLLKAPRIMFIDACRGNKKLKPIKDKAPSSKGGNSENLKINPFQDFITIFSNVNDTESSWTDDGSGSHLILAINAVLKDTKSVSTLELNSIIKKLRIEVLKSSNSRQCVQSTSSVINNIYIKSKYVPSAKVTYIFNFY